jgi:para-nitrobenzyl esterase
MVSHLLLFGALLGSAVASISIINVSGVTIKGKEVAGSSEFLGIPFAKAERWKIPEDIAVTDLAPDTFDATAFGPCCPQIDAVFAPNQKEDCLNLNVFTKDPHAKALAPVLFFIYGGGGTSGCSAQSEPALYNGTNLISRSPEPVVVVTFNYRLSVLANLYLEGAIVDGLQTRDWLSALRWVNKHISKFGVSLFFFV